MDTFEDRVRVYPKYVEFIEDMRQIVEKFDAKDIKFTDGIYPLLWKMEEYQEATKDW